MQLPDVGGILEADEVAATVDAIARVQLPNGMIPWFPGGHSDPWNHVEAAMALLVGGRRADAERAYEWLRANQRPDWELSAARLGYVIARRPEYFAPKNRWAMDWYYPVLSGVLTDDDARARLDERWDTFVMEGLGVRCVADRPWVTAAETCECVMAYDAAGEQGKALALFDWAQHLRLPDGSYWTGMVYPEEKTFPGAERSTYTAAAVVLAADALAGSNPTSGLFRGETLPVLTALAEDSVDDRR